MKPPPTPSLDPKRNRGRFEGVSVLVVEDHEDSRELLVTLLKGHGMLVRSASCLREAVESFDRNRPELIVSDLDLPDGDGCSFIERVRELGAASSRALPAIATTAFLAPEVQKRALGAGFQACLAKPYELEALLDLLEMLYEGPVLKRTGSH